MKYLIAFFAGALVGAAAALMLAPKSGSDLRTAIHDEAVRDQGRIREGYESARVTAQERYDKVQAKLHKEAEEADVDGEAVDVVAVEVEELGTAEV